MYLLFRLMFAAAAYSTRTSTAFAVMVTARIFMGLAAGAAVVILHRMKAHWFLYRELALSFSVQLLVGRCGSAICFILLGSIVDQIGLRGGLWLGFGTVLLSAGSAVALAYLDQRGAHLAHTSPTSANSAARPRTLSALWRAMTKLGAIFWCLVVVVFFYYGTIQTFMANAPNFLAVTNIILNHDFKNQY